MKTILFSIILFSIMLLCVNCDPCKRLNKLCPAKDSITYVETVTDNPYYTIPDTAYWTLLFECDSSQNVILRDLEEANNSVRTETVIKEVVRYTQDNKKVMQLSVSLKAMTDSILIRDRLIEKLKNTVKTVTIEKEVPVYKCRKFFIYCTIAFFVCIVLTIGWIYLKNKAKILSLIK